MLLDPAAPWAAARLCCLPKFALVGSEQLGGPPFYAEQNDCDCGEGESRTGVPTGKCEGSVYETREAWLHAAATKAQHDAPYPIP